jgi:hypothetical protein
MNMRISMSIACVGGCRNAQLFQAIVCLFVNKGRAKARLAQYTNNNLKCEKESDVKDD